MSDDDPRRLVARWAGSGVRCERAAARLAHALGTQPPGTRVPSREEIAAEYGIGESMAQRARLLLQGAGIIFKAGRHLYVSEAARDLAFMSDSALT